MQMLSPASARISSSRMPESMASRESKSALIGELQHAFGYTRELA